MKKTLILSIFLVITLVLAGCGLSKNIQQNPTGTINSGAVDSGDNIAFSTGDIKERSELFATGGKVIITQENSGAIVSQLGNELIYRNEVYGFQFNLTEKAKGVKLKDRTLVQTGDNGITSSHFISFYWDAQKLGNISFDEGSLSYKYPSFQRTIDVRIMSHEEYNNYTDRPTPGVGRRPLEEVTIGKNNKYYFLLTAGNASHDYLTELIPSLTCKDRDDSTPQRRYKDCGNWIEQLMTGFTTFDIE